MSGEQVHMGSPPQSPTLLGLFLPVPWLPRWPVLSPRPLHTPWLLSCQAPLQWCWFCRDGGLIPQQPCSQGSPALRADLTRVWVWGTAPEGGRPPFPDTLFSQLWRLDSP